MATRYGMKFSTLRSVMTKAQWLRDHKGTIPAITSYAHSLQHELSRRPSDYPNFWLFVESNRRIGHLVIKLAAIAPPNLVRSILKGVL